MRSLFLHFFFWLIITTGLIRIFTGTGWIEQVGWAYNSIRRLKSLRRRALVSHPTSKTHVQSDGRSVDAEMRKPRSMRRYHAATHTGRL
jgi:hypothetical protein